MGTHILQAKGIHSLQAKPPMDALSKHGAPPDQAPANPTFVRKSDGRTERVSRGHVGIPIVLGMILEVALSSTGQTLLHGISSRVKLWQSWLLPLHRML